LDFRILDASAFYSGVPFGSSNDCYTTSLVYEEIKHIKKNHDALGTLLETNRLKIMDPDKESTEKAIISAKETGDFPQLSKQDISIIALCINLNGEIIKYQEIHNQLSSINIAHLQPGIYFLKLINENDVHFIRFVKQ